MKAMIKFDFHMHSTVSDGTDTPQELLRHVREAGIGLFALTDHDAVSGCRIIRDTRAADDPKLVTGVEFSCRDEHGKYHILGYGFDPDSTPILDIVALGHCYRMKKVRKRLDFLQDTFGFVFSEEDVRDLLARDNPGKPHIANLMVKYGYATNKEAAIREFISQAHFPGCYVRPEEAIRGILGSGGIPVLAHPAYGAGDDWIVGPEMEQRLCRLKGYGLQGVEGFYSGFTAELIAQTLSFAEQFGLYVTAGSDYHGRNKMISLGEINLKPEQAVPERLKRFLERFDRA